MTGRRCNVEYVEEVGGALNLKGPKFVGLTGRSNRTFRKARAERSMPF
jgi:hypothetical protein